MPLRNTQPLPTAVQAVLSLHQKDVTCEELVRGCLANIDRSEGELCAWEHVARDAAVEKAIQSDATGNKGALSGVVVGIKDVIDTSDMPTTYGSPIFSAYRPERDAACVTRLRDNGAIILGKTVTTEFAYLRPPRTSNPLDLTRTPGGSSSGSAAAVAEGMVPVALGTQTVGSLIRPAAFCGIVGFKPTFGEIPTIGVRRLAESLDTMGILARCIEDVRLVVPYLMSSQPVEPTSARSKFCFVTLPEFQRKHAGAFDVVTCVQHELDRQGVAWTTKDFSSSIETWWRLHRTIVSFEAFRNFQDLLATQAERMGDDIKSLARAGSAVNPADYSAAISDCNTLRRAFDELLDDSEVLIVPSTLGEAPPKVEGTGDPAFNIPWTFLHVPAATIPVTIRHDGMPLGLQVIAKRGGDQRVLCAAGYLVELLRGKLPTNESVADSDAVLWVP